MICGFPKDGSDAMKAGAMPMFSRLSWMRRVLAAALALGAGVGVRAVAAGPTTGPSEVEQITFGQKTTEAQMQELQERMFRLAELTRQSEPDDSARLLLAVRKAREELIIEDMRSLLQTLGRQDYAQASEDEKQVLVKLDELRRLLTTTDLDLQIQLEQLRRLNLAISKLDAAVMEQRREQKQSGQLADQQRRKALDQAALGRLLVDQQQNHRSVDGIGQTVKDLGPIGNDAAASLASAGGSMSGAEGQLGGGQPGAAEPKQGDAVAALLKARQQLEAQRQKVLQQLEREVRAQVVQNLSEMLDRQKSVRGATEALASASPRVAGAGAMRLAAPEEAIGRICDSTVELIEETQFSIALPPMLRDVRAQCGRVQSNLESGLSDAKVVGREKRIEQDLQDLLDTFKQLANAPVGTGSCNCKGNKNKLLAELKVLRLMEQRVNADTIAVDGQRAAGGTLSDELRQEVLDVRDRQDQAHDVAARIHQELYGPSDDSNADPDAEQAQ